MARDLGSVAQMSIRKIADAKVYPRPCQHPTHQLPNMWCPEPGTYVHTCDGCGQETTIVIPPRNRMRTYRQGRPWHVGPLYDDIDPVGFIVDL